MLNAIRTSAFTLLPALTGLIQTGRTEPWLRPYFVYELSALALRPKGVRSIIEFVLSVHPSSNVPQTKPEDGAPKGPPISMEALSLATKVVSSPPLNPESQQKISADEWFRSIAPQLFHLLDGQDGLEMVKVASYVIGYGILGRREYGAPGSPGWRAIVEPIIGSIDPTLRSGDIKKEETDGIVTIRAENVLVSSEHLFDGLRRLASLVSSHPNPGLSKRLLRPLMLPLWSLASWRAGEQFEEYRGPAKYLLSILLRLSSDAREHITISDNLLFNGNAKGPSPWTYAGEETGKIWIEKRTTTHLPSIFDLTSGTAQVQIDAKVRSFMEVLQLSLEEDSKVIAILFLRMCKRWLQHDESQRDLILRPVDPSNPPRTAEEQVVDAKILQAMIDAFPNRLVGESSQVLELAENVLAKASQDNEEGGAHDDTVGIALSLLNMVFTSSSFKAASMSADMTTSLQSSLRRISSSGSEDSGTAQNLLMLLEFKLVTPDVDNAPPAQISDQALEDRRTYKLAVDYLTTPSNPTPVRAQGLDLLTSLITSASPVLDVPATIILLSSLLQDDEEYIYLRTIKAFTLLSVRHPKSVMNSLLERYFDADELLQLDARLRLGEALLQVIEKSGQLFTGDLARHVCEGLLALAGRRGYRPKTEAEKQKRIRKEDRERKRAEKEWDGLVPQLDDIPEGEEEDPILNQIVTGWEGKRGEEDVRIRASALSIFGTAVETNIAGIGAAVVAGGMDLSVNILPLEPEPEKAILRRAAVLAVLSVIRAHDREGEEGKQLGFGFESGIADVKRVFAYVQDTDNDGLVKQHAKDVLEELESWQLRRLDRSNLEGGGGKIVMELGALRGLGSNARREGSQRPRIEEIE